MKRTIALLAVLAMLVSFVSVPALAATAPAPVSHEAEMLSLPERVEPMAAETLNEALNVPGGTLDFSTYDQPDYAVYAWVVEEDWAKSTNEGRVPDPNKTFKATQSQVKTWIDIEDSQAIQFRFKVSCQNAADTDWFGLFVDRSLVQLWYGEEDWTTVTVPISAGYHEFAWIYNKDGSIDEGKDAAWLDDVEVVPCDHYTLVHSQPLDDVLNAPGGTLEFYTPAEAANGYYPWTAEDGYAKSTNQNEDANTYSVSIAAVQTTVDVKEGEIFQFRYKVSSEDGIDWLHFYVDGERVERWSGQLDWAVHFQELTPGRHELRWEYTKDKGASYYDDTAYLDDVYLGAPEHVTSVALQKTASVPGYRSTQLTWEIFPDTAYDRNVRFTSSDENIATVDANGVVTGVTQGQAVITVTTNDGSFTDTCLVSVTADQPPANIYGFMYAQVKGNWYSMKMSWCSFKDTNPADVQTYSRMPMTPDGYDSAQVICAELVDDTVYGYTKDGYFFAVDLETIKNGEVNEYGELDITYKEINVTGDSSFYPNDMAYDYSTGTMYVVNYLDTLYQVDLETGDIIIESGVTFDGEIPNLGDGAPVYVNGLAIDLEGNAYVMLAGFGANWGGNGCSRLASLDLATGEFTVIGQTTAKCFQEQTMCFDHNTGKLYWAQLASVYKTNEINFYIVDTETAELTDCGKIGGSGAMMAGLFIPICQHEHIKAVEAHAPTCTAPGNIAYWQCTDCGKCYADENRIEEIPVEEVTLPAAHGETELKNAKAATCTEDGYTGDEVCAACGEVLKQGEIIPATGHGETEVRNAKPATETEDGYTGDTYCKDCGELLKKGEVIPATGHKCPSKGFSDLNPEQWYHPYTDYVLNNGLMVGMGGGKFSPNGTVTRAMLVTTLYRVAGEPEVANNSTFTDVPQNQWYAKAVAWAQNVGIAKGVTDTTFCPNENVTREQAAAFLYRYVTEYLKVEPAKGADLSVYKDADKISGYAQEAVAWATAEGIFEGFPNGTMQPKGTLVRVQLAKVLTVLNQKF